MADGAPDRLDEEGIDRRALLGRAAVATVATFWFEGLFDAGRRAWTDPTAVGAPRKSLTEAEWIALAAAHDRMLPSGGPGDPGARDVNSIGYLDAVLADPDIEPWVGRVIHEGAAKLDEAARASGARSFATLPGAAMDTILRGFEATNPGLLFLQRMVVYLLESFLGDPIHGGNVGEVGWRWAHHTPGLPRPVRK